MMTMTMTIQQLKRPALIRNFLLFRSNTAETLSPISSCSLIRNFLLFRNNTAEALSPLSSCSSSSRSFSSPSSSSPSGAGAPRMTGRPRFYKEVDVTAVNSPWFEYLVKNSQQGKKKKVDSTTTAGTSEGTEDVIQSPVSAGVDGTQSATGVRHIPKPANGNVNGDGNTSTSTGEVDSGVIDTAARLEEMFTPRNGNMKSSWYGVTLDGRKISTPMGQVLAVPSQRLAYMIAAEWDNQTTQLQPTNMPFMTLACTALDQAAFNPDVYQNEALKFLPTDTTCFWADPTEDRLLHRKQEQAWQPLHDYVEATLGDGSHAPSKGLGIEGILMARKRGSAKPYAGLPHPTPLVDAAKDWTTSLDAWQLVALSSMASQCKSWLIAYALLDTCVTPSSSSTKTSDDDTPSSPPPFSDMAAAIEASRVEEEFQISIWGMVEGQHDYDRLNASIQLYSAQLFAKSILLEKSNTDQ